MRLPAEIIQLIMERKTFLFRKEWYDAISELAPETKAKVFDTICKFALYHITETPTDPMVKMAMAFIQPDLVADCEKWMDEKEKRKAAANARWSKEKQNMQVHASASTCMQSNANDADNVSSLSMFNNNSFFLPTTREMPKEKKEEFIYEIGKKIMLRGFKKPITEAKAFFNHNQSTGWIDAKGRRIQDATAWVDGWKCCPENYVAAIEASAREFLLFLTAAKIKQPDVLEGFRGMEVTEKAVIFTMTRKAHDAFEESINEEVLKAKHVYFGDRQINYQITR